MLGLKEMLLKLSSILLQEYNLGKKQQTTRNATIEMGKERVITLFRKWLASSTVSDTSRVEVGIKTQILYVLYHFPFELYPAVPANACRGGKKKNKKIEKKVFLSQKNRYAMQTLHLRKGVIVIWVPLSVLGSRLSSYFHLHLLLTALQSPVKRPRGIVGNYH